tara:strand:- start:384 stop:659 length:276 start_codon:yes stop_codon:yes gene_type:complete
MNRDDRNKDPKLFEFRIKYISRNSQGYNYHYYLAENAEKAVEYQVEMMDHKHWEIKLVSLERKSFSPYASKSRWIDESNALLEPTQDKQLA